TTTYALTSEFHFFFFIHYSPTVIYTLSLHDALPILSGRAIGPLGGGADLRGTHALHPSLRLLRSTAGVGAGGGCDGTGRLCGVRRGDLVAAGSRGGAGSRITATWGKGIITRMDPICHTLVGLCLADSG